MQVYTQVNNKKVQIVNWEKFEIRSLALFEIKTYKIQFLRMPENVKENTD